jgi:23S rRNA pseudouridine2605 synthase
VAGRPSPETLRQLRRGLVFAEGTFRVQGVRRLGGQGNSTFLEIDLKQGRNREIRRMLARVGHKVLHLERVAFGPLFLGRLPSGKFRKLTDNELKSLRELAAGIEPLRRPHKPRRGPRPPHKAPRR